MPPKNGVLDDFNRADEGPPPSSSWANNVGNVVKVLSNAAGSASSGGSAYYKNGCFGVLQEVSAEMSTLGAAHLGMWRQPGAGTDGYVFYFDNASNFGNIQRVDNGTWTILGDSFFCGSVGAGDAFWLEANRVELLAYVRLAGAWSLLARRADMTYRGDLSVGLGVSDGTARWDNFIGGPTGAPESTDYQRFPKIKLRRNF